MQAIKQYTEVINGCISIQLPKDFTAKRVKLLIVSADEETNLTDFQKFLLESPEMSEQEYQFIAEKRQHFALWK
jgi:hypothetical protein